MSPELREMYDAMTRLKASSFAQEHAADLMAVQGGIDILNAVIRQAIASHDAALDLLSGTRR